MKSKRQGRKIIPQLTAAIALALILPAAARFMSVSGGMLSEAGERAAILSAAINMPDSGIELLRERFISELYGEAPQDDTEAGHDAEHPQVESPISIHEEQEDEPEPIPDKVENPAKPKSPRIPEEYIGPIASENFAGRVGGTLIQIGGGFIKNDTKKSDKAVLEILEEDFDLGLDLDDPPQVLLFHTHTTESFEKYDNGVYDIRNTWRSTDNNGNMAAVGAAMQEAMEAEGMGVLHDVTQHDYPSYNGSYERSAKTVEEYQEEYPSLKILLDLHRDAMERDDGSIVKPVAMIDGKKAAQIMIIVGCDDGTMNMPNWERNLRFAAAFQNKMEEMYPDLTRPIYFCYRKYNMDLSDGSLLLEFGSNANTLDEAVYSAQLAGKALAELIKERTIS